MVLSKVCTRCRQRKPSSEFNKRAKAKDGLRQTCKGCDKDIRNNWEQNQKVKPNLGPIRRRAVALEPASAEVPGGEVEAGVTTPPPGPPGFISTGPEVEAGSKVIGRIGEPGQPRIREVVLDPDEEIAKEAAREYAALLNKKLPIRKRASLMVEIAKNAKGPTAALALSALRDINLATGVVSKQGTQVDLGALFIMPGDTSKIRMQGT